MLNEHFYHQQSQAFRHAVDWVKWYAYVRVENLDQPEPPIRIGKRASMLSNNEVSTDFGGMAILAAAREGQPQ